jgi:hypothetical protein
MTVSPLTLTTGRRKASTQNPVKANAIKPVVVKSKSASITGGSSAKDLAAFIQLKKAASNQRMKFLAAAVWLSKNGNNNLVTRDVTRALKASRVPALINPSQYLNQNVKQGFLRKSGDHFLLTKKGTNAL